MIEPKLDDELMVDSDRAKDSLRSRQLVLQHLKKLNYSNIHVVANFGQMITVTKLLVSSVRMRNAVNDICEQW